MQRQQQAEHKLLRGYGCMVTLTLVLVIVAVIGIKYFSRLPPLSAGPLEQQHSRWVNVLTMVRAQWLSLGKPSQLQLTWQAFAHHPHHQPSVVTMNEFGWPAPPSPDGQGCQQLWQQLMGTELKVNALVAEYVAQDNSCHFHTQNGDGFSYQQDFGRVIFLASQ